MFSINVIVRLVEAFLVLVVGCEVMSAVGSPFINITMSKSLSVRIVERV